MKRTMAVLLAAPLFAMQSAAAPAPLDGSAGRPGMDLGSVLGGLSEQGFLRADAPRAFTFPGDHGTHPDYRSEWWYLTAHLEDDSGRPMGVQFTLFRQALSPPQALGPPQALDPPQALAAEVDSRWRTRQVWMAHLALTEADAGHLAAERFARGALDLAGVRAAPFAAWLDDWRLESVGDEMFPLRLTASVPARELGGVEGAAAGAGGFTIDLVFEGGAPPVLQGEDGLSRKSERAGNASYYYSLTRLPASGSIRIDEIEHQVRGLGWLDREWSTSALDPGQVGWDWFALHLDDGRDLMIYRIRRDDGSIDLASAGILVSAQGDRRLLSPDEWTLQPLTRWDDGEGGAWPIAWHLAVPSAGIDGRVEAVVEAALNRLSVRYWEGMVCLTATLPTGAGGCGYLELTGYGSR